MRRTSPLIVGGGPAGSAAAIALAKADARPLLIERSRETGDALCGGFLSWRTLANLESLGVSAGAIGGHPVATLRLFAGSRHAEAPLPGGAVGVSRRKLDSLLLARASDAGAGIERGVTAKRLDPGNIVVTGDGGEIAAETLFIATGKHDLAGLGRPRGSDPALGLRVRLGPHPALTRLCAGAIELHLFAGGYAGLVLQEDGSANLCLAVRKSALTAAGGDPETLLRQLAPTHPALGERLAFMAAKPTIDAIGAVPYGWIARETVPGLFRLGDQAGVIPSLAGEGNGIAIASGIRAAQAWREGHSSATCQAQLAASLARPIGVAKAIWRICERPTGAAFATGTMRMFPAIAGTLARATRIGDGSPFRNEAD